ncbi:intein C-terminal splicing region, partial [Pseudovibrio axinellae]
MSDILKRLEEKSISDFVRKEELEQVFDVGQFEKVEVSRSFDPTGNKVGGSNMPVKIGTTVESKYSYITEEYETNIKLGGSIDLPRGVVGIATDGKVLEVNGKVGPLGVAIDTDLKIEGTIEAEVAPNTSVGFFASIAIASGFRNLAKFGAGFDAALYEAMKDQARSNLQKCFPGYTLISTHNNQKRISEINEGDTVLAFDPRADSGRTTLVPKIVSRTFTNITEEWLRLTWFEDGKERVLVTTPGHEFLSANGDFRQVEQLVAGGTGAIVLADGSETVVRSERLVYSAETADMFEQAEGWVYAENGNLALKPVWKKGWRTYNFEVEDYHTYVAGGVRVHNDSYNDGRGFDYPGFNQMDGNATVQYGSSDSHLAVNGEDFTDHQLSESSGFRNTAAGKAQSAAYAAANAGYSDMGIRGAALAEYAAKGGNPDSTIGFTQLNAAIARAKKAAALGLDPDGTGSSGKGGGGHSAAGGSSGTVPTPPRKPDSDGSDGWVDRDVPVPPRKPDRGPDGSDRPSSSWEGRDVPTPTPKPDNDSGSGGKPMLLDLDDNGISVIERQDSTVHLDIAEDGYQHQTAWVGSGDGVLFIDLDGDGKISDRKEVIFTDWAPSSDTDAEALRRVFDSDDNGVLDANDERWSEFKVMVTAPDGSQSAKTLEDLGIVSIDLTVDRTRIDFSDGSSIDGETTFTRSDGTTGRAVTATLAQGMEGYVVSETVSVDDDGNTITTQNLTDKAGELAQVITRTTSSDGLKVEVAFDSNADGVTDRVLVDETLLNDDGSRTRTETNRDGGGVLLDRTVTTTNPDQSLIVIERDNVGGGYPTQRETQTENADNSFTVLIENLAPDGSVLNSSSTTLSADRFTRSQQLDADGNGIFERTLTHQTIDDSVGGRLESDVVSGADGTLLSSREVSISADQSVRTEKADLDGDQQVDLIITSTTVQDEAGATTTTESKASHDNTVFSKTETSISTDGHVQETSADLDGDGAYDWFENDTTVLSADGGDTRTILRTSADGSELFKEIEVRNADGLTGSLSRDADGDGHFDLTVDVTRDASGTIAEETIFVNADGSLVSKSVKVTSADGLSSTTKSDLSGNGLFDQIMSDIVIQNLDGSSTQIIESRSGDNTLLGKVVQDVSADGMSVTRKEDKDGDGRVDETVKHDRTLLSDGSQTEVLQKLSGDGSVLERTEKHVSADRRSISETIDSDGDGNTNLTTSLIVDDHGGQTQETSQFSNTGELLTSSKTTTSGNGLSVTVEEDVDGDGQTDQITHQVTTFASDGSSTLTTSKSAPVSGPGVPTLLAKKEVWTSGNKLDSQTKTDADGDGDFDNIVKTKILTSADGTVTTETKTWNGTTLASVVAQSVSANGLIKTTHSDTNGDGLVDLVETVTKTLNADGSTQTVIQIHEGADLSPSGLRSTAIETVSATGRVVTLEEDLDGDGTVDRRTVKTTSDDGTVETLVQDLAADGRVQSQDRLVESANGLTSSAYSDRDGDGTFETLSSEETVLNADGSSTTTFARERSDGTLATMNTVEVSGNGLTSVTSEDIDGDGTTDQTTLSRTEIAADGTLSRTEEVTAQDGSLIASVSEVSSGNGRSSSQAVDLDGDGGVDQETTIIIGDDGATTTTSSFFDETETVISKSVTTTSGNGLMTTTQLDVDGDGTTDRSIHDITSLDAGGGRTQTLSYQDEQGELLASQTVQTSGNGFETTATLDLYGDGTTLSQTERNTALNDDGTTSETLTTTDASGSVTANASLDTSSDGLNVTQTTDFDGNGESERQIVLQEGAAGGRTETDYRYDTAGALLRTASSVVSADGQTKISTLDADGDGTIDQEIITELGADNETIITYKDLADDGSVEKQIIKTGSANGRKQTETIDVDGDGIVDTVRITEISYDQAGSQIETFEERDGAGQTSFKSITTTSANGLSSSTSLDLDGDGETDATRETVTKLNADGSTTRTSKDWFDEGSLQSSFEEKVSKDGRIVEETYDFDGDGRTDQTTITQSSADGSSVVTETGYTAQGAIHKTSVMTTSSDGLRTTIERDGVTQTISRSVTNNGSYTWDNGVTASATNTHILVTHEVDSQGIETWKIASTVDGNPTTQSQRLDSSAKARILVEAAQLYDTVLDRDLDPSEIEVLVRYVEEGQLKLTELANVLLDTAEYQTRYGTLTDV